MKLYAIVIIICVFGFSLEIHSYNDYNTTGESLFKNNKCILNRVINLNGSVLRLPDNMVLSIKDDGGFVNGKIIGKYIRIEAPDKVIFNSNVETCFEETELKSCWFDNILDCIANNVNCNILITSGEYIIKNKAYLKICSSLFGEGAVHIKHDYPFSVGDNVTIEGIVWNGQDKADYWIYCQPNNLIVRNCKFSNYYGKTAGIIFWSRGERDTKGLIVENCVFGRLGARENGIIGDMEGGSTAIFTYRCNDVIIRNNIFEYQYGTEDADAIKIEGNKIDEKERYPIDSGDEYRYSHINALVESNYFYNVPKSPIKIFASGVTVKNNIMSYQLPVKTAITRIFRSENIIIEMNHAVSSSAVSNMIEIHACKNVRILNNELFSKNIDNVQFGDLLRIEASEDIQVDGMNLQLLSSSKNSTNQSIMRLSGKNISISNSSFSVPYAYYGIYAPKDIEKLTLDSVTFIVEMGLQYAFLINNATSSALGKCSFINSNFLFCSKTINDVTSYGAVFAQDIIVKGCKFDYAKNITLSADKIVVTNSYIFGVNVQNSSFIYFDGIVFSGNYSPIVVGELKDNSIISLNNLTIGCPDLALIRFRSNIPNEIEIKNIISTGLKREKLIHFDNRISSRLFYKKFANNTFNISM